MQAVLEKLLKVQNESVEIQRKRLKIQTDTLQFYKSLAKHIFSGGPVKKTNEQGTNTNTTIDGGEGGGGGDGHGSAVPSDATNSNINDSNSAATAAAAAGTASSTSTSAFATSAGGTARGNGVAGIAGRVPRENNNGEPSVHIAVKPLIELMRPPSEHHEAENLPSTAITMPNCRITRRLGRNASTNGNRNGNRNSNDINHNNNRNNGFNNDDVVVDQ